MNSKKSYLLVVLITFGGLSASDRRVAAATSSNSYEDGESSSSSERYVRRTHFVSPTVCYVMGEHSESRQEHLYRLRRELVDSEYRINTLNSDRFINFDESSELMQKILEVEQGILVDVSELKQELENKQKERKEEQEKFLIPKSPGRRGFATYSRGLLSSSKIRDLESEILELKRRIYQKTKQHYEECYSPEQPITICEGLKSSDIKDDTTSFLLNEDVGVPTQEDMDELSNKYPMLHSLTIRVISGYPKSRYKDGNKNTKEPGEWEAHSDGCLEPRCFTLNLHMKNPKYNSEEEKKKPKMRSDDSLCPFVEDDLLRRPLFGSEDYRNRLKVFKQQFNTWLQTRK